MSAPEHSHTLDEICTTLKRAASALQHAAIPFAVGGSVACWARGGPEPHRDLDLLVKPEHAELALEALQAAGMRPERPPETWLLKAWDGDLLIDLIFQALGLPIDDDVLARADELNVFSMQMRVARLEDVLSTKLLALTEHELDYSPLLAIARAVREQVDWAQVRSRTSESPFARVFFALLEELGVLAPSPAAADRPRIRVLPS